jgi:hypothetical protein
MLGFALLYDVLWFALRALLRFDLLGFEIRCVALLRSALLCFALLGLRCFLCFACVVACYIYIYIYMFRSVVCVAVLFISVGLSNAGCRVRSHTPPGTTTADRQRWTQTLQWKPYTL